MSDDNCEDSDVDYDDGDDSDDDDDVDDDDKHSRSLICGYCDNYRMHLRTYFLAKQYLGNNIMNTMTMNTMTINKLRPHCILNIVANSLLSM